jgi:hypothetical protein
MLRDTKNYTVFHLNEHTRQKAHRVRSRRLFCSQPRSPSSTVTYPFTQDGTSHALKTIYSSDDLSRYHHPTPSFRQHLLVPPHTAPWPPLSTHSPLPPTTFRSVPTPRITRENVASASAIVADSRNLRQENSNCVVHAYVDHDHFRHAQVCAHMTLPRFDRNSPSTVCVHQCCQSFNTFLTRFAVKGLPKVALAGAQVHMPTHCLSNLSCQAVRG